MTEPIYLHLFENPNWAWVNKLAEMTDEVNEYGRGGEESATPAQPNVVRGEHQTDKPLKYMVAVEGLEPPARGL